MARFRVLATSFSHQGRSYKTGDVVESSVDLCKTFANLFEKVDEGPETGKVIKHTNPPEAPAKPPVEVADVTPPAAKETPLAPDTSLPEAAVPVDRGREVTKNFKLAVDEDFRVFKSGLVYLVFDADDMTAPLNPKGCKRGEVVGIINKALED